MDNDEGIKYLYSEIIHLCFEGILLNLISLVVYALLKVFMFKEIISIPLFLCSLILNVAYIAVYILCIFKEYKKINDEDEETVNFNIPRLFMLTSFCMLSMIIVRPYIIFTVVYATFLMILAGFGHCIVKKNKILH